MLVATKGKLQSHYPVVEGDRLNGDSDVLVIIPTYNEAENIAPLIQELSARYANTLDILVIDDNSPDGTATIIRTLQRTIGGLYLMSRAGKLGLGTAYIDGFRYALNHGYSYIIEMDADYSHDPNEIHNFLTAIQCVDIVIGSRYVNSMVNVVNWPLRRLILSKMASVYTRLITGMPIADPTSGFKCFKADVLRSVDLSRVTSQGYSFQIEMNFRAWKKGFVIQEIPIVFVDRTVGKSKMSKRNIREAMWMVWWLSFKSFFGLL